jgi:hypothetical protein
MFAFCAGNPLKTRRRVLTLRRRDLLAGDPRGIGLIGLQETHQSVQMESQQVLAADVQDDALAGLLALAEVLHQAEVLVAAMGGLDGAKEHGDALRVPKLRQAVKTHFSLNLNSEVRLRAASKV